MKTIELNRNWILTYDDLQQPIQTEIPASVMNDLLQNGRISDPFYRDNEDQAIEIASKDYLYETSFSLDDEMINEDSIKLRFQGLDTLAEIKLNGSLISHTNNMHRMYEFEVKELLNTGENHLSVKLKSPINYIKEKQKELALWGVPDAEEGYPHLRKGHSMFGWDWGPRMPDLGIWRNVNLTSYSKGRIDDVYITQQHHEESVMLNFRIGLEKLTGQAFDMEVTITDPNGKSESTTKKNVALTEEITHKVEQPQLWWPNGYGKQPLYTAEVTLLSEGKTVHKKTIKTGLRTIRVKHEKDEWGKSFEFEVNGLSLFAMGANYIPEDNLLARNSREKTKRLITDCVDANYNMLRVWGGGIYPESYFYELCDEYGLIVWQDFMFACSTYDLNDEFRDTVVHEVIDNVKRLRHHASLGIWCGNNEIEEGWEHWEQMPNDPKRKADYIKLFEYIIPELLKEHDPETFYWSSSPSSGGGFDKPRDPNRGDVHYWEVWHGLKPFTEYEKYHFRFCSEFGFQSFPSIKTIDTFTEPEDRNIFSRVMEKHQKNGAANGKILFYLSENFLYPKDFESLIYASQLLQVEAIKYGVEHWRRNRGRCMGSLYWQLNDCWPVASWSSIDYYGRWKALHYFARKFYAPLLLSVREEGENVEIHVTNDTREAVSAEIEWKLKKNNGEEITGGRISRQVSSLSAERCDTLSFLKNVSATQKRQTYLECSLKVNDKVISNVTHLFVKPKHFTFIDPEIQAAVSETQDAFEIVLSSQSYAKFVELDMTDNDCVFSDNFVDLSPDRKVTIIAEKNSINKEVTLNTFKEQLNIRSIYDMSVHESSNQEAYGQVSSN
ncbi:glycoside hydrolase family 2 [Jeotgalibacillus proteolyticus]|uniref:Beta-mannosidase B n=2 Tax=Jeotgalibacillus proteolyticus TaxID=2082395 RepID=A0A2S5G820_9BACL|nr:glycoside hydrolase family 2 [Jeotgalibacillus proteolyticus]